MNNSGRGSDFAGGWRGGDYHSHQGSTGHTPRGGGSSSGRGRGRGRGRPPLMDRSNTSGGGEPYGSSSNNNNSNNGYRYDGNNGGRPMRGGGGPGIGGVQARNGDHSNHQGMMGKPGNGSSGNGGAGGSGSGGLVPVKPKGQPPIANMVWRVLYAPPAVTRPEVGPTGEQIPGPFSPPLRPSTPEQTQSSSKRPQDVLRKQNELFVMKQRVHQLLQQAANSPSAGYGTYVGKLSNNSNSIIPVLPRPDP